MSGKISLHFLTEQITDNNDDLTDTAARCMHR